LKKIYRYIRFAFQVTILLIDIIAESLFLIFTFTFFKNKYNFARHYHRWAKRALAIAGIKLTIIGAENINPNETYVFASNHSSHFDIPIIYSAIQSKVAIIYKKELEKIPIFGWKLNKSFFVAIDRTDGRKAMASVIEALNLIKQNVSIIIYPEGTRSKDGKAQEFKRGAFVLAAKSGKDVVPVTIVGSNEIMPKDSLFFEPREVQIVFHKPIGFPAKMSKSDELAQVETIRQIIISGFDKAKKHLAIS